MSKVKTMTISCLKSVMSGKKVLFVKSKTPSFSLQFINNNLELEVYENKKRTCDDIEFFDEAMLSENVRLRND
jgi:hypothetical protein